ncbi:hypothetical protein TrVE_jg6865 [Triparma verrucosa]|nr:hypothetical protein TrVE_jg6865 [Triparma verrucosa]
MQITHLKSLASHPMLLKKEDFESELSSTSAEDLTAGSCKLAVLQVLVSRLIKSKFRVVIFSQSVKMIQIILRVLPTTTLSITGSTPHPVRSSTLSKFNSGFGSVLILSTKVGGVGITLTSATRAIIYEPSWNPADDRQAVDRIYRIGQTKPCTIYRFCAAGTVEERMYEKQVFKDGVRRSVFNGDNKELERYHGKEELKDLFSLGERGRSRFVDYVKEREREKAEKENDGGGRVNTPQHPPFRTGGVTPVKKIAWTNRTPVKTPAKNLQRGAVETPVSNVKGGTGKRTFLEEHESVVGVTAHDNLYVKVKGNGTPFGKNNAATPKKAEGKDGVDELSGMMGGLTVLGRGGKTEKKKNVERVKATRGEAKVVVDVDKTVDYGNNFNDVSRFMDDEAEDAGEGYESGDSWKDGFRSRMDKTCTESPEVIDVDAQPVERGRPREPREVIDVDAETSLDESSIADSSVAESSIANSSVAESSLGGGGSVGVLPPPTRQTRKTKKAEEQKESDDRFSNLFNAAISKSSKGENVAALDILLDAIDINTSDKALKMECHKKIALLSDELGWLSEDKSKENDVIDLCT